MCSEILGADRKNRPVKIKFSWCTADARTSPLELRNKADAQPSTLVQLHRIYLLLVQGADLHQAQFSCEAFCLLEGVNNESFLSCNELILVPEPSLRGLPTLCASSAVLSEVSFGMQGNLLLIKPLLFRLQYRLAAEEKVIQVWLTLHGGCLRIA